MDENTVTFKYPLFANVVTPFGSPAIVNMRAEDQGGIQYYVKTEKGSEWFTEAQLSPPK